MMEDTKKHDSNVSKEIVERPVDIFYGDMLQIISLSFQDIPELNCVNNEWWEVFLRSTWDKHFPEIDNLLDFLRYCVYHTGLVGRFYKMNCILLLDDAISLLKNRLPNPDVAFKVWHKLHKIANLILKEICKESSSNTSLILDLHVSTNSTCDNSEDKKMFLTFEALPNEEERTLIYHITICYNRNHESALTGYTNLSSLKPFSNTNDDCADYDSKSEVLKISKSTTSPNQDLFSETLTDSNDTDQWEKYGARPKNKRYSLKNRYLEKEFSDSSLKSYSNMPNVKENYSSVDAKENTKRLSDIAPVSTPSALAPLLPSKSNVPFSAAQATPEDDKWWRKYGARPKVKKCEILESEIVFKTLNLLEKADVEPKEISVTSGQDQYISPRNFLNVQSIEKTPAAEKSFNMSDVWSEAKRRALQESYDALFLSYANSSTGYKSPVSDPDDKSEKIAQHSAYKSVSVAQENTSLQWPFISFPSQSTQENIAGNDLKNPSSDMNIHEYDLKVRGSILRHVIKTFFENNKFSDMCLDDLSSIAAISNNPVKESCSALPPTDFQFNSTPFANLKNSLANVLDVSDQATELSHGDQNSGHLAINKFDDKISFNWEHFLETETSIMGNSNPTSLQEVPSDKTEEFSKNNVLFLDGKQMPLETSDDFYGTFFKTIVQQLTDEKPIVDRVSPEHPVSLQSSTHKNHSTPEKRSKLASLYKTDDQFKSQESSEEEIFSANEKFSDHSEESLKLSDLDNSLDCESASDIE